MPQSRRKLFNRLPTYSDSPANSGPVTLAGLPGPYMASGRPSDRPLTTRISDRVNTDGMGTSAAFGALMLLSLLAGEGAPRVSEGWIRGNWFTVARHG